MVHNHFTDELTKSSKSAATEVPVDYESGYLFGENVDVDPNDMTALQVAKDIAGMKADIQNLKGTVVALLLLNLVLIVGLIFK